MSLLALECSSGERSVAVGKAGQVQASTACRATRDTPLFAMIDRVLGEAAVSREAIETLVVGLGPGSYTGVRGAIAAAQGWSLARPVRLLGIASADAIAHRAWTLGHRGPTAVVIDAQRGEFYLALHRLSDAGSTLASPLRLASRADVIALGTQEWRLVGPDLEAAGLGIVPVSPDAAALLALAVDRRETVAPEDLEPVYLRATSFVKAPPSRNAGLVSG